MLEVEMLGMLRVLDLLMLSGEVIHGHFFRMYQIEEYAKGKKLIVCVLTLFLYVFVVCLI